MSPSITVDSFDDARAVVTVLGDRLIELGWVPLERAGSRRPAS